MRSIRQWRGRRTSPYGTGAGVGQRRCNLQLQDCRRLQAVLAKEVKGLAFRLFLGDAMASAVLPNLAFVARHAMGAIIVVLTMFSTNRTVEIPRRLLFETLKFLFASLHICFQLPFGDTRTFSIGVFAFGGQPLEKFIFFFKLLFLQDALDFALFETLLAGFPTLLTILLHLLLASLLFQCHLQLLLTLNLKLFSGLLFFDCFKLGSETTGSFGRGQLLHVLEFFQTAGFFALPLLLLLYEKREDV